MRYRVNIVWQLEGHVIVDANSKEEAAKVVRGNSDLVPDDGRYVEDSIQPINEGDPDCIMQLPDHMKVCESCLCAIEAHEGRQFVRTLDPYEWGVSEPEELECDFCNDSGFDQLFELI